MKVFFGVSFPPLWWYASVTIWIGYVIWVSFVSLVLTPFGCNKYFSLLIPHIIYVIKGPSCLTCEINLFPSHSIPALFGISWNLWTQWNLFFTCELLKFLLPLIPLFSLWIFVLNSHTRLINIFWFELFQNNS